VIRVKLPKLRKNGDGRAFAVYPKSNGKREYFGEFGTEAAEKRYSNWLSRWLSGAATAPIENVKSATVADMASRYVMHIQSRVSHDEWLATNRALELIVDCCGHKPTNYITTLLLTDLLFSLTKKTYKRGKRVELYTRDYLNLILWRWKKWFRWLAKMDYIDAEIYTRVTLVDPLKFGEAQDPTVVEPVSIKQVLAIKQHISPLIFAMMQVQYLCGMRPQDVCNLRFCEIDTSREIWIYRPSKHKTARFKHVLVKAIPKAAQEIINRYRPKDDTDYVFRPADAYTARGLSVGEHAKRLKPCYSSATYGRAVSLACVAAGVPTFRPNRLRHAIATDLNDAAGIEASQYYLGHSTTDMTEIYVKRKIDKIIEIAAAIDNPFIT
jgi:integrase